MAILPKKPTRNVLAKIFTDNETLRNVELLFDNLFFLLEEIETKSGVIKNINIVNTSPYTPTATDQVIFVDTDSGDINITLPSITEDNEGADYRIINTGNTGNRVYLIPDLSNLLFGVNDTEYIGCGEALIINASTEEGWQ